jgi:hypothetical protein
VIADTSYVQRFLLACLAIDTAQRARSEVKNQLLSHVHCVQFHCFGVISLSSSAERSPNADSKYLLGSYSSPNFTNDQMVVPKRTLKVMTPIHHQVMSQL